MWKPFNATECLLSFKVLVLITETPHHQHKTRATSRSMPCGQALILCVTLLNNSILISQNIIWVFSVQKPLYKLHKCQQQLQNRVHVARLCSYLTVQLLLSIPLWHRQHCWSSAEHSVRLRHDGTTVSCQQFHKIHALGTERKTDSVRRK